MLLGQMSHGQKSQGGSQLRLGLEFGKKYVQNRFVIAEKYNDSGFTEIVTGTSVSLTNVTIIPDKTTFPSGRLEWLLLFLMLL